MNYNCLLSNKYEHLCNSESSLDMQPLISSLEIKQAEINFYNDDNSFTTIVIEENLRSCDLCQLLALKNHVAKDVNWCVVEYIEELGLERLLEDHEEVLKVYISGQKPDNTSCNKFYFRKNFQKYEFFRKPQLFFPPDMTILDVQDECLSESTNLSRILTLQSVIESKNEMPTLFGNLWMREGNKQAWKKAFFLLREESLFYSFKSVEKDPNQLCLFAHLNSYNIYNLVDIKKNYKTPTEFCFCLKSTEMDLTNNTRNLLYFCADSNGIKMSWIVGLRLAKYGKQLRENYHNFSSQKSEILNGNQNEYSSQKVLHESLRSRVAMDFTGPYGKIVKEPKEAEAIALAEGHEWNKRLRQTRRVSATSLCGLNAGIHMTQPWFHSGLTREEAVQLLNKHGTVDGVFLVRESHSTSGVFVLSFVHSEKNYHIQIIPMIDGDKMIYTLDNGKTKFYDVVQLVEFYQLNSGSLPTKLTHYVTSVSGCNHTLTQQ